MEHSLVIIKPDGTSRRRVGAIVLKVLKERGLGVKAFQEMKVSRPLAEMHYEVHNEKPFFLWLCDFITSSPVLVIIFEAEGAIQTIRDALGATFVQKAEPDTLRGKYGIWAGVNIAHASDAPETATNEIQLWTSEGGLVESATAEEEYHAYIDCYIKGDADYTMKIRKVVTDAIDSSDSSDIVLKSLIDFLGKDAKGIEKSEIEALAKVIFDYIIEEIEKK